MNRAVIYTIMKIWLVSWSEEFLLTWFKKKSGDCCCKNALQMKLLMNHYYLLLWFCQLWLIRPIYSLINNSVKAYEEIISFCLNCHEISAIFRTLFLSLFANHSKARFDLDLETLASKDDCTYQRANITWIPLFYSKWKYWCWHFCR